MYMYSNYGSGLGYLSLFLILLIKLFFVILIITFLVGLIMAAKNFLLASDNTSFFKGVFVSNNVQNKYCTVCNKPLDNSWKVCPHCGNDIENNNIN